MTVEGSMIYSVNGRITLHNARCNAQKYVRGTKVEFATRYLCLVFRLGSRDSVERIDSAPPDANVKQRITKARKRHTLAQIAYNSYHGI